MSTRSGASRNANSRSAEGALSTASCKDRWRGSNVNIPSNSETGPGCVIGPNALSLSGDWTSRGCRVGLARYEQLLLVVTRTRKRLPSEERTLADPCGLQDPKSRLIPAVTPKTPVGAECTRAQRGRNIRRDPKSTSESHHTPSRRPEGPYTSPTHRRELAQPKAIRLICEAQRHHDGTGDTRSRCL